MDDARDDQEIDEQLGEEMGIGAALPIVVGLLDPRPQATAPELQAPSDNAVAQLAKHTYAAAALRAVDLPLPPMGKFYSSAELSHSARLALQTILFMPGGWKALSRAGFATVAGDLLKEKVLPPAAVGLVAAVFGSHDPEDPEKLAMARKFVGLGFLQYVLDHLAGTFRAPCAVQYNTVQGPFCGTMQNS